VVYFWDKLKDPFLKIKSLLKQDGLFYFFMVKSDDLVKLKFAREDVFNKYSISQVVESLKLAGFREIDYFFDYGYFIKARK
jgi:hypothetical protein